MVQILVQATRLLVVLGIMTGLLYPFSMNLAAQWIFPKQANGSLLIRNGQVLGSTLIGQPFDDPRYFWGRLSATAESPFNAAASSGSNLGPANPVLQEMILARRDALRAADPQNQAPVPIDLVTASASGLDPHISVDAAFYQIGRVARARGIDEASLREMIQDYTEPRQFGIFGQPRVNVLMLNLALDGIK